MVTVKGKNSRQFFSNDIKLPVTWSNTIYFLSNCLRSREKVSHDKNSNLSMVIDLNLIWCCISWVNYIGFLKRSRNLHVCCLFVNTLVLKSKDILDTSFLLVTLFQNHFLPQASTKNRRYEAVGDEIDWKAILRIIWFIVKVWVHRERCCTTQARLPQDYLYCIT